MKGDGNREKVKHCPLINEYCIKEKCALWCEVARHAGGLHQRFGLCAFNAMVTMLSEISIKAQPQQQKVQLPNLYRG